MSTKKKHGWCWRTDLLAFRGLSDRDKAAFLILLEWFENFRLRMDLEAGREAATTFWREEVTGHGRKREDWSRKRLRLTRSF